MVKMKLGESATKKQSKEPKIHLVQKAIGGDTFLVLAQSSTEIEDEYPAVYYQTGAGGNLFLAPPYVPRQLLNLVQCNNVLNQCVTAMEVNVDGTGFDFVEADDDVTGDPEELKTLKSFFNEPYPNESFVTQRRKVRRNIESVGYGYYEVLRNIGGDVLGMRSVDTHNVRMVRLDGEILVTKTISRNGEDVEISYYDRERRFVQRVGNETLVYYREFGSTRQINRRTGMWETPTALIPPEDRGTELIIVGVVPDVVSPYYVPRWVNEMPSVVGSRKAEEQNLQFLDSGGMPPAIIFIQGGTMAKDASDQLREYLSGKNKEKNRAVVVETQSSSGSLDSAGTVQVRVERFGSQEAQDAMFMKYDVATEDHVRVGFRLPPLFLGKAQDYNFATAMTAYMVAEAQVFQPERAAFDELMNKTIIKELGIKTWKIKSNPITLKDVASTLEALGLAATLPNIDQETVVDSLNDLVGIKLEVSAQPTLAQQAATIMQTNKLTAAVTPAPQRGQAQKPEFTNAKPQNTLPAPQGTGAGAPASTTGGGGISLKPKLPKVPSAKIKKSASELVEMVHSFATLSQRAQKSEASAERFLKLKEDMTSLSLDEQQAFVRLLSDYNFGSHDPDFVRITKSLM